MAKTMVFNEEAMERQRAAGEQAMQTKISSMQYQATAYSSMASGLDNAASALEAQAAGLDEQAAAQELIANTAMKTEYYIDSDGKQRSRSVPDTAARSAAAASAKDMRNQAKEKRAQAKDKRAQAAALRAQVSALNTAIGVLNDQIDMTNKYIKDLIAVVQETDLSYAAQME